MAKKGKPKLVENGVSVGTYIPQEIKDRLEEARAQAGDKTISTTIRRILTDWAKQVKQDDQK